MNEIKLELPKWLAWLFMLGSIACFITLPIIGFYVMPKSLVWLVNIVFDRDIPFNLFTWAISMYLLWVLGIMKFTTSQLKDHVKNIKKPE